MNEASEAYRDGEQSPPQDSQISVRNIEGNQKAQMLELEQTISTQQNRIKQLTLDNQHLTKLVEMSKKREEGNYNSHEKILHHY